MDDMKTIYYAMINQSIDIMKNYQASIEEKRIVYSTLKKVDDNKEVNIQKLLKNIYLYDIDTYKHSIRVAILSILIAYRCKMKKLENIAMSALLHDYGKIYIPLEIICKKGLLSLEERDIVKSHTTHGFYILSKVINNRNILNGVYEHHESFNGTENGYPRHLGGTEINIFARIIAVADKADAYGSKRSYHDERDISEVETFIINCEDLETELVERLLNIEERNKP